MLEHLFFPEKVAVIGASRQPGKVGHDILANLVRDGFAGEIIPVNPSGGTLFDLKVYAEPQRLSRHYRSGSCGGA
jgi:acetate---CoA ligase (ADP-forming)